MNADHIYETETMAELCARQGRTGEAIAIYRRLVDAVAEPTLRKRVERRLAALEAAWQPLRETEVPPADIPLPSAPGVAVVVSDDQVTVAWALPVGTSAPALDLLLLQRTSAGIELIKRTFPLAAPSGRLGLTAPALHSAVAAAGTLASGRFIPLARSRR
jgi:hypothetical protein